MKNDNKPKVETIEEFLARGGKIEKIPTVPYEHGDVVSSTIKGVPELKTLAEGELLYGKKKKTKKKKAKQPDYSNINLDLIPEHLKSLINKKQKNQQNKEESNEADKNN